MTGHDSFDAALVSWLEDEAEAPIPAGVLDHALVAIESRRPRPEGLAVFGSRWIHSPSAAVALREGWRISVPVHRWRPVVLLLLILALIGAAVLIGSGPVQHLPVLGRLAYGLEGDIYLADWDGRNPVRIVDGLPGVGPGVCDSYWGEGSMWSPDGRHFAYRSAWDDVCAGTVYIGDPEGHTVASFPGTGWLVSWSPDSTRVVTWVGEQIGIYGLDGVRQALLTVPIGFMAPGDHDPVWSPDGTSLVVPHGGEVPLDGGKPFHLPSDDPLSKWQAAYSPDGSHAAYLASPSGSLSIAAADGSEARVIFSEESVESFVWSPTGDRIALCGADRDGRGARGTLRLVDVTSGTVTTLAGAGETDTFGVIRFSPEGNRILFARTDSANSHSLWSVRTDGSDPQLLVAGTDWGDWQWRQPGS
jgi:WD40 repeat protein